MKGQNIPRVESRRHSAKFLKTSHEQPRTRQQRHRKRHLHTHEQPLQRMTSRHLRAAGLRQ